MNKNTELIFENRFQINPEISNTKLRKLCNFYKIIYIKNNKERTLQILQKRLDRNLQKNKISRINNQVCIICMETLTDNVLVTRCMHAFCEKCILNYLNYYNQSCPVCRHDYHVNMFIEDNQLSHERMHIILPFSEPTIIQQLIVRQNPIEEYIENENIDISVFDVYNNNIFLRNFVHHLTENRIIYTSIFTIVYLFVYIS